MESWLTLFVLASVGAVAAWRLRARSARRRSVRRLQPTTASAPPPTERRGGSRGLRRWLALAGFRRSDAPRRFVACQVGALLIGLVVAVLAGLLGLPRWTEQWLADAPGHLGRMFVPLVGLLPWIAFVLVASVPLVLVRAARRRRVEAIERDLPVSLELLATLSEAGLGFDSGIARTLDASAMEGPFQSELRTYQLEKLAGSSRVDALRRLAGRVDVPSVSGFVSALVQAEQMGAGLADVLRRQADDLRNRRRERSLMLAQQLPVKLVFPLVICFLPGVFAITLGPAFHAFYQVTVSGVIGGR